MDDEKLLYPFYERLAEGRAGQRVRAQGALPAVDDQAVPEPARVRRRARRRQGGQGLAAAQLRHLPLGVPLHRRRAGRRLGAVRADGPRRLGDGPRRDPGEVRRDERLRRPRPDLRAEHGGRAAPVRRDDGAAREGARRRPRGVGHRRHLDRRAAVADRGAAPAGDPRGHAAEARLRAARPRRRPRQARDLRRELRAALRVRPPRRALDRPHRGRQGHLRAGGAGPDEPALRVRDSADRVTVGLAGRSVGGYVRR